MCEVVGLTDGGIVSVGFSVGETVLYKPWTKVSK